MFAREGSLAIVEGDRDVWRPAPEALKENARAKGR
jgi:hypothetical protein